MDPPTDPSTDPHPYASPIDFGVLAAGALGFTVALAWNDAVSVAVRGSGVSGAPGLGGAGAGAAALHAAVVTALVVVIAAAINAVARAAHVRHDGHENDRRVAAARVLGAGFTSAGAVADINTGRPPRPVVRLWSPQ